MRNSSSLDWLRFMHTPNDYRVSPFNMITKDNSAQYLINSETIIDNSKDCLFPTLIKVKTDESISFVYPIVEAFSIAT